MKGVGVLGAGSWGLALSLLLSRKGLKVTAWEFDPQAASLLVSRRERPEKLPGVKIPPQVKVSTSLKEVVGGKEFLVFENRSTPGDRQSDHSEKETGHTEVPGQPVHRHLRVCARRIQGDTLSGLGERNDRIRSARACDLL